MFDLFLCYTTLSRKFRGGFIVTSKGFTLTELLVVVIIIATLAAFAMPAYQRAVLKSRYHTLIPVAQGIHKGEEVFYAMNRHYTNNLNSLPISTNVEEGTTVVADHVKGYVRVSQAGLNNSYVMYQSKGVCPAQTFCEAKEDDDRAIWLCANALGGIEVDGCATQSGYIAYSLSGGDVVFNGPIEEPHEPVHYEDDKTGTTDEPLTLEEGDTCTTSVTNGCQYVDASGEDTTCTALSGNQGCANSAFDDRAICIAGDVDAAGTPKAGCQYNTFTNGAQCIVNENSGTQAKDTACGGDDKGGRVDTTPNGDHSAQYYGAECINDSTSSFGCGRSWYQESSTCTSSTKGGCGNSVFDASRCIARGNNACDKSTFRNGSVCEAWASGTCPKSTETTYDSTSYCTGKNNNTSFSYCPSGLPAEAGDDATRKTWRACTTQEKTAAQAAGFSTSGLTCAG